jgi:hypothetical protein
MKLLIFPGGGNPDTKLHREVFDLIGKNAARFGYSEMDDTLRWPGQRLGSGPADQVLTFDSSLEEANAKLAEHEECYERDGIQYDVLARSYGTYVALKSTMVGEFKGLRRIVLWGAPSFWVMWKLFVRELDEGRARRAEKGLHLERSFFPSLEPIEWLLQETPRTVVVTSGSEDVYSPPAFQAYLMQLALSSNGDVRFRPIVQGAPHETRQVEGLKPDVIEAYLNCVLG